MKLKISLIFCAFFSLFVHAQKSAPVAGDAATLIDLLKKDYGTISSELRAETISNDMAKATAIFSSYLTDNERASLNNFSCNTLFSSINAIDNNDNICNYIEKLKDNIDEYNIEKNRKESRIDADTLNDAKNEYYKSKYYFDVLSLQRLQATYKSSKNIYLSYLLQAFIDKYHNVFTAKLDALAQINYNSSVQKALPFLGGDLSFSTFIDGLSRFLVNEIKKELTVNVINKIQHQLNHPSENSYINELLVLLPVTTDYLKSFEASQVLNFIDDLKQYIEKDLNNIINNLDDLRFTPRFQKLIQHNPDLDFAFEAFDLINQVSKTKNPLEYFDIIENSRNIQRWANSPEKNIQFNIANTIKLTSLLAHSLLVIDDGKQKLASLEFMSDYGSIKNFYFIYIGLLHQQNTKFFNVTFATKNGNQKALDLVHLMEKADPYNADQMEARIKNVFAFFKEQLTQITSHSEKLQTNIEKIKKANKNKEDVAYTDVYELINSLIDFSEEIATTSNNIIQKGKTLGFIKEELNNPDIIGKTTPYFQTARSVNEIFLDLHKKNYTTAIISALEIPSSFSNNKISIDKLLNLKAQLQQVNSIALIKEFISYEKIPSKEQQKDHLEDLAVQIEYLINTHPNNALQEVKSQFTSVHKTIKEGASNTIFKEQMSLLKSKLKANYKLALKEYANLDIDSVFISPIQNLINKSSTIPAETKTELTNKVNKFVIATVGNYVFKQNDSDVETAAKELIRYLPIYLPQLSNNVFRIKNNNIIRIVHFINNIASASTPEDVQASLEAFALPSGSSSIKEKTNSYVSINSYPGVLGGIEFSNNINNASFVGITAPVGIYAQFGSIKKGTLGLFVPIIDIGAPVRFRLDSNNDTETLPDFNFKDIFSPGIYLSYGFANSPFAINAGVQYGPKLRDIKDGNGDLIDIESYRIGIGFVIDIPLFTLHNKGIE